MTGVSCFLFNCSFLVIMRSHGQLLDVNGSITKFEEVLKLPRAADWQAKGKMQKLVQIMKRRMIEKRNQVICFRLEPRFLQNCSNKSAIPVFMLTPKVLLPCAILVGEFRQITLILWLAGALEFAMMTLTPTLSQITQYSYQRILCQDLFQGTMHANFESKPLFIWRWGLIRDYNLMISCICIQPLIMKSNQS